MCNINPTKINAKPPMAAGKKLTSESWYLLITNNAKEINKTEEILTRMEWLNLKLSISVLINKEKTRIMTDNTICGSSQYGA
jgi:hypothetical protein